jgi:C4-dicarboxylate transporter DctM subunit
MVLYALVMDVSVGKLFMAGFLPGIFVGLILMAYCYLISRKYNWKHKTQYTWKQRIEILKTGIWGIMVPFIVLGGIYGGIFTPTEAAAVSVIYAIIIELFVYKELQFAKFSKILIDSAILSACILFILSSATTFIWLMTSEGLTARTADFIMRIVGNKYIFLLLINILLLILGSFIDIVAAIIVISPILLEALNRFNIDLIHYGIVMILNMQCGFITPPFGFNLFVSMGLTKEPFPEIARSVLPFIFLFIFCLLIITYVPEISLFLPKLLMGK